MNSSPSRNLVGVQALRGLAAMLVVVCHATQMIHWRMGAGEVLVFGGAGVDLFFPISGFVMTVTTYPYWGQARRAGKFMLRRLVRIVPLYWAATLLKVLALLAFPAMSSNPTLDPWHVVASFLFIPAWDADHRAHPILVVGWTLHYEMLFYAMFALALWLRVRPAIWAGAVLAALSFLPLQEVIGAVGTLASPILLEFIVGMGIGWAYMAGRTLPRAMAPWCLAAACIAVPLTHPMGEYAFLWRPLVWGVPGALALAAMISLEGVMRERLSGWPERLGDASYAIYLTHGFVLPPLGAVMSKFHLTTGAWPIVALVLSCLASAWLGMLVYRYAERPLTDYLNARLSQRRAQPSLAPRA